MMSVMGTPQPAIDLMNARIDVLERSRGTEDPQLVQPLLYLAESLAASGRTDDAKAAAARSARIKEKTDAS